MGEADDAATRTTADRVPGRLLQPDFIWSLVLFLVATGTIAFVASRTGLLSGGHGAGTALFFLVFGLFTITMGYPHPNFGHASFDRVSQVASLLVLGPLDAALINGLASLLWPWHRLWLGVPVRDVATASLHNAGLMSLVILGCGTLYQYAGGPVPIAGIDGTVAGLLLLLLFSMQLANDAGMLLMIYLRRLDPTRLLNVFSSVVEIVSGIIGILVAIVFVRMETSVLALLLVVLGLGMLVLKQFALMRHRLERLVDERTEELRLKSLELERQATRDKLTGLLNRRYADDFLQREIEASQRGDREMAVALADIDHFKRINDTYSHAIGDEVLRRVSRLLVSRCRKTDVVARYGGEEFLLCFPDTTVAFAARICGQIRSAVETMDWSVLGDAVDPDFGITISVGIAEVGADARRTTVLNAADMRLYAAKREGRNRVVGG
ncbi:MAG: GGDEF domain-containing protein [Woeseiaceae bacterium]|nr:GGDEF domain-containing protein [Woeseiaceae bacterium]